MRAARPLAAMFLLALTTAAAHAETKSFAIGRGQGSYTENLTFAQTTLPISGVTLSLSGLATDYLTMFDLTGAGGVFANGGSNATFAVLDGTTVLASDPFSVSVASGTVAAGSALSVSTVGSKDTALSNTLSLDPSLFEGTGSVTLTLDFTPPSFKTAALPANLAVSDDQLATGSVTVTFAPIPEPAGLAILGLGMAGLAMLRRRR